MGVLMTSYLNWTCVNCHTVNYITVSQKDDILKKLDPRYPAQSAIIKCSKCSSQVVVEARNAPRLPSAEDLDAIEKEREQADDPS